MFKKIAYTLLAGLLCLGCMDLDRFPLNGPSSGTFPSSKEEAEAGLLAAYKGISNMDAHSTHFPTRLMDVLSDIGAYRVNPTTYKDFMRSDLTASNSVVEKLYKYMYKILGRVHLVLDNLDNLADKIDENTLNCYKAELLAIRAYCYEELCKYYGDVPFIDHSLSLTDYAYPRVPVDQVIDRILADLDDDLIECLPVQWPYAEWGTARLGRVGVYALKARICLYFGRFDDAAKYSKKALDLADGVYALEALDITYYPDHTAGEPLASNLFGYAGQDSKEWIWAVQYNRLVSSNIEATMYYDAPRIHNGCSWQGPSQHLIDAFQCKDGLSIVDSPLYNWQDPWANRDPRLDLFCLRPGQRAMGMQYELDVTVEQVFNHNTNSYVPNSDAVGNKSEYGANGTKGPGGYLWRKYYDMDYYGRITGSSMEDDLNMGLIRLADVILVDAEANIEMTNGDLARARADINKIRARVGMPPVTSTTQAELRSALRYERMVELADEGYRWYDIRRWDIAEKAVNGVKYAPGYSTTKSPKNYISNAKPIIDADWVVKYDETSTWDGGAFNLRKFEDMTFNKGKDELWPIPETEQLTNPAITYNNPGYPYIGPNQGGSSDEEE